MFYVDVIGTFKRVHYQYTVKKLIQTIFSYLRK